MSLDLHSLSMKASPAFSIEPKPASSLAVGDGAMLAENFQTIFGEKLAELVDVSQETSRLDRDFAAGVEGVGIDDVMISAAKSGLAMDTAIQVRNLAFRAFQSLTQLR